MNNKILLVEDDNNLGFVIQDQLSAKGHEIDLSIDGEAALQKFKTNEYEIGRAHV